MPMKRRTVEPPSSSREASCQESCKDMSTLPPG
jgi:hypothetical protein